MHDPNPETDIWQESVGSNNYYGGEPYSHGINCVRGQAAEAISSLLYHDSTRLDALRPALHALSQDPIISVRTCAINAFLPLLNFARDEAVELFLRACRDCVPICGTPPFEEFVHYAIYSSYPQLRELLQFALNSPNVHAVEYAARQIALAELDDVDVGLDAFNIRAGTETMRKSAANVYARNLRHEVVGDKCGNIWRNSSRTKLNPCGKRCQGRSVGFPANGYYASRGLSRGLLRAGALRTRPIVCCTRSKNPTSNSRRSSAAQPSASLEFLGKEGTHIAYHGSMIAISISTLIVRQYEQTTDAKVKSHCLDLIDRMERVGYLGIGDELNKIDR